MICAEGGQSHVLMIFFKLIQLFYLFLGIRSIYLGWRKGDRGNIMDVTGGNKSGICYLGIAKNVNIYKFKYQDTEIWATFVPVKN